MSKIVLITCVSQKCDGYHRAEDLYTSPFFVKNLAYAKSLNPDKIFILSAKYGLLSLDEEIENYDMTLNDFKSRELKKWAERTLEQLRQEADLDNDHFVFLAGKKYRQHLLPKIKNYDIPLQGLGIGKQLQYLKSRIG